jgi:hypothetical protein
VRAAKLSSQLLDALPKMPEPSRVRTRDQDADCRSAGNRKRGVSRLKAAEIRDDSSWPVS